MVNGRDHARVTVNSSDRARAGIPWLQQVGYIPAGVQITPHTPEFLPTSTFMAGSDD